jgi:hypothetical protein
MGKGKFSEFKIVSPFSAAFSLAKDAPRGAD